MARVEAVVRLKRSLDIPRPDQQAWPVVSAARTVVDAAQISKRAPDARGQRGPRQRKYTRARRLGRGRQGRRVHHVRRGAVQSRISSQATLRDPSEGTPDRVMFTRQAWLGQGVSAAPPGARAVLS
eukprot:COSAG02_NODE_1883_length_10535_cov_4.902070_8_plen_126_part_00